MLSPFIAVVLGLKDVGDLVIEPAIRADRRFSTPKYKIAF